MRDEGEIELGEGKWKRRTCIGLKSSGTMAEGYLMSFAAHFREIGAMRAERSRAKGQ